MFALLTAAPVSPIWQIVALSSEHIVPADCITSFAGFVQSIPLLAFGGRGAPETPELIPLVSRKIEIVAAFDRFRLLVVRKGVQCRFLICIEHLFPTLIRPAKWAIGVAKCLELLRVSQLQPIRLGGPKFEKGLLINVTAETPVLSNSGTGYGKE